jgi:hypothetical protein
MTRASILTEVKKERERQIEKGHTPEKDKDTGAFNLVSEASTRLSLWWDSNDVPNQPDRQALIEAAALTLAALELLETREKEAEKQAKKDKK